MDAILFYSISMCFSMNLFDGICFNYTPINDTPFELHVFLPSDKKAEPVWRFLSPYHYPLKRGWWRYLTYRIKLQMFLRCHFKSGNFFQGIRIQSTPVISKSKGPSETLRDIRTSTYQMCRIEENTNRTTKFHKWTCNLTTLVRNICWKYCGKGEKLLLRSNFSSYPQYFVTCC